MKKVRCAIYTRKSSEEGLEQDFNSLHAQREACAAYILSQTSEGWSLLPGEYDDGGISGGTLERPALQRLLADIEAGRIDIVVVYKVDRLTRSLLDFAKLVETMDRAEVSFVSVTQSFNTTTSMGRLTLNMLLSFAQFEREVTAERIRDKIAASKAKGMWMGGIPPLGYRPEGRTLAIVDEHARLIRCIFERYLEFGPVRLLVEQLALEGVRVPVRTLKSGRQVGGGAFGRGQVYAILSNPVYVGEIHHRGNVYPGQHEAVITRELWDKVHAKLAENTQGEQRASTVKSPSLLSGKISDEVGTPLVASHACKGKVRYRYYVSDGLQKDASSSNGIRIPAKEIETAVTDRMAETLDDPLSLLATLEAELDHVVIEHVRVAAKLLASRIRKRERSLVRDLLASVKVDRSSITLHIDAVRLREALDLPEATASIAEITIECAVHLKRTGMAVRLVEHGGRVANDQVDRSLVDLLVQARKWWERLSDGETSIATLAREEGINDSWISRVVRLNFMAPEIVAQVLEGRQPAHMNGTALTTMGQIPGSWEEQKRLLLNP